MIRRLEFLRKQWDYYLILERRVTATSQYVDFDVKNYDTFSNEYANLLLSICAEADVMFKLVCGFETSNTYNISHYKSELANDLSSIEVDAPNYHLPTLIPFFEWDESKSYRFNSKTKPFWWEAYNKVKHNRFDYMEMANLKNVVYALGGLFILENRMLRIIADEYNCIYGPDRFSELFEIKVWKYDTSQIDYMFGIEELENLEKMLGIQAKPEE